MGAVKREKSGFEYAMAVMKYVTLKILILEAFKEKS